MIYRILFCLILCQSYIFSVGISEYWSNKQLQSAVKKADNPAVMKHADALLQDDSMNGHYLHNKGQAALLNDNIQEAITYYNQALDHLPLKEKEVTLLNLSAAYLKQQELEPAIDLLESILTINPKSKQAKHNLEVALSLKQMQEQQEQHDQEQQHNSENNNDNSSEENRQDSQEENQQSDSENQDQESRSDQESTDSNDSELDKQKEEALARDAKEQEAKEDVARAILNTLSQREEEARKKYSTKGSGSVKVDYDW